MTRLTDPPGPNDLLLVRMLKAPRALIWRCWTEPALLCQWFCPKPWYVSDATVELKPGGDFSSVMCGPNGEKFDNHGAIMEVVPQERLVFTDTMTAGWRPAGGMFTAIVSFADLPGGGTRYTALAMHRTPEDREKHEQMGFEPGWGAAAAQLDELALSLP